jgi:hypothetical protein
MKEIGATDFYADLERIATRHDLPFRQFPNFRRYVAYVLGAAKLNRTQLRIAAMTREFERYHELVGSQDQLNLVMYCTRLRMIRDLVELVDAAYRKPRPAGP